MSFNPNLVVSHEVNKAFQSNNFPRWFYYYNFTGEAMGEDFIPYGEAMAYRYSHNAVFEIIGADSKSLGFKKLEIDHSSRTTKLTSIELAVLNVAKTNVANTFSAKQTMSEGAQAKSFQTTPYATGIIGTFSIDTDTTSTFIKITIIQEINLSITKAEVGMQITLQLIQDGLGGGTVDWSSDFRFPGGVNPITSTAPNVKDIFTFICSEENKLDCVSAVFNLPA